MNEKECSHVWIPYYVFTDVDWCIPAILVCRCEKCDEFSASEGKSLNGYGNK